MVYFSFKLNEEFVSKYVSRNVDWGFKDAGGNSLGELTFIRTYSRVKDDGSKEHWWEVCRRVIEGMYSIQKDYVKSNKLPWNGHKAQSSAQEAFDRMFNFKWTPPGRGLWVMGTDFVMNDKNGAALQNCAFVSTRDIDKSNPGEIFGWAMDALMLGIGVGWDTKAKDRSISIYVPEGEEVLFSIDDSREGWVESARLLINSHLKSNQRPMKFDYSNIRPEGSPIRGFGGTASGAKPLIDMHDRISKVLSSEAGNIVGSRIIADIMNLIGTCVVAGNIRRCLPYDSPVQTSLGPIPISDIRVGDSVIVGGEKHRVSAHINSGMQQTIKIKHRFGTLECTPNHQVATFDSFGKYSFKDASNISIGDRLVWDSIGYAGDSTHFNFSYAYQQIKDELNLKGWKPNGSVTVKWLKDNGFDVGVFLPSPVVGIESGRTVQTYDIEVEDVHQFTTNGIVVHNSAELALGQPDDDDFINLKNAKVFPERNSYDSKNPGWGWMSNNSLDVTVGQDYSKFVELIKNNGEPGFAWMDVTRDYGRLIDPPDYKDHRADGYNPCAEQCLESHECCTLVEVHINRAESKEDYLRTLKFAYLYGKTVTLLSTHWDRTNAVMQRNRRIGTSLTGLAGFSDSNGLPKLRQWMNDGYAEIKRRDHQYSEWLCVRESIKTTSVKPSGSVSLLSGATPGVHWAPGGKTYMRAIRFAENDPIVPILTSSGYKVEPDLVSSGTVVAYFPIKTDQKRGEKEVTIFEKINLAAEAQAYWSDNSVSVTVSFDAETEGCKVDTVLKMYEGKLKTVSFLPIGNEVYPQQPYTAISIEEYDSYMGKIKKFDTDVLYSSGREAEGDRYCTTDVCEIKSIQEMVEDAESDVDTKLTISYID